ncbi:hypothetical protein COOONC_06776 [Cooperia oncophora]
MEKHSRSLLDMLAWASNTITLETYRNRYVQGLESVMQQLHGTVEHTLTKLFSFGRLTQRMMQMSSDRSVVSVIEQLMGEKVFKESLLALHGSTALGAVKATVIGMNDNMIEMEICYPTATLSQVKYVLHVEPLGQFSWNMDSFWTDNVGQRYAVEKEHKHATLDSLLSVPDVGIMGREATRRTTETGIIYGNNTTALTRPPSPQGTASNYTWPECEIPMVLVGCYGHGHGSFNNGCSMDDNEAWKNYDEEDQIAR